MKIRDEVKSVRARALVHRRFKTRIVCVPMKISMFEYDSRSRRAQLQMMKKRTRPKRRSSADANARYSSEYRY